MSDNTQFVEPIVSASAPNIYPNPLANPIIMQNQPVLVDQPSFPKQNPLNQPFIQPEPIGQPLETSTSINMGTPEKTPKEKCGLAILIILFINVIICVVAVVMCMIPLIDFLGEVVLIVCLVLNIV